MPAGLIIYNDSGTILIDDNFTNMSIVSSGMVTTYDTFSDEPMWEAPLPFVLAPGEKVALRSSTVYSTLHNGVVKASGVGNVYWYRIGPPTVSTNAGLQVFNAAGVLTFDSGRKYARVRATVSGSILAPGTHTYEAGRDYAVIHSRRGLRGQSGFYDDGFGHNYRARHFISSASAQNGALVGFDTVVVGFEAGTKSGWDSLNYTAAIIDVTGY